MFRIRRFALAAVIIAAAILPHPVPAQTSSAQLMDSLSVLRKMGRFAEASAVSGEILKRASSDPATPRWQLTDADWRYKTFSTLANASPAQQAGFMRADSLYAAHRQLLRRGAFDEAIPLVEEVARIEASILGQRTPHVAGTLGTLASLNHTAGHLSQADSLYDVVLDIRRTTLGRHPDYAATLSVRAEVTLRLRGFTAARAQVDEAVSIAIETAGPDDPRTGEILMQAGGIYWQDDLVTADAMFRRALAILRVALGPDASATLRTLNDFGIQLNMARRHVEALEVFDELVPLYRSRFGDNHFYTAFGLNERGNAYTGLGRYEESIVDYTEAMNIHLGAFGDDNAQTAVPMHNLAVIYTETGRYAEAESLVTKVIRIWRRDYGETDTDYADALTTWGDILRRTGRLDASVDVLRKAVAALEHHPTGVNRGHLIALSTLAQAYMDARRWPEAESALRTACNKYEAALDHVSEGAIGRATFSAETSPWSLLATVLVETGRAKEAWATVERDRARVLYDLLGLRGGASVTDAEAAEIRTRDAELQRLETILASLKDAPSTNDPNAEARLETQKLEAEAAWKRLHVYLREKYPVTDAAPVALAELQSLLPDDGALIGWLDTDEHHYGYAVRKTGGVVWTPVDGSVDVHVSAISNPDAGSAARTAIYNARLAPLADALAGVGHVIVVAAGAMSGIPVEALGGIAERWSTTYAPSATIYCHIDAEYDTRRSSGALLALADPDFGKEPESPERAPSDDAVRSAGAMRRSDISNLPRLPATREEVESIEPLFNVSTTFFGPDASEMALYHLSQRGELKDFTHIHIATHGVADNRFGERSSLILSQSNLPDMMTSLQNRERVFDGMLTMGEVMREWHLAADLVVLSACQSGLGQYASGEGYIGFAHAFFHAGARNVLVSLWEVADQPTRLLMTRFYENLRDRAMQKADALAEARLWLAGYENQYGRRPYAHPTYWAGFVLIGPFD